MNAPRSFFTIVLLWMVGITTNSQTLSSNLPLLSINTNGVAIENEPKTEATLSVFDKGKGATNKLTDIPVLTCKIGIEIRGSTSQSYPKKSYGFETCTETGDNLNVPLLGLPSENDWVLYAPYSDKTFIRDILVFRLFRNMEHYASRYVLCEVVLNDDYIGVYVLFEKIKQDKNRVNISKLEQTSTTGAELTGGYIFKIDKPTGSVNEAWASTYLSKIQTGKKINFLYHDPSADKLAEEQKEYIQLFVTNFEKTLASENYTNEQDGYRKLIDINSFVDYFIVNEISKNVDSYRTSAFFHKDRDDKNGKLVAGPPWDYNLGFGNANYNTGEAVTNWIYEGIPETDGRQVPFWWRRFLEDPAFYSAVKQRYTQFRQNILSTEKIHGFIDSLALVLKEPQARNYATWKILGKYVWPNPYIGATYQQEIDYLKKWVSDRLAWIDGNLQILSNQEISQIVKGFAIVYPNPFIENLNIEILPETGSGSAMIEIYGLTGEKLFGDKLNLNSSQGTTYLLNENWGQTSTLAPGTYILRIKLDNGKEFAGKIIKN